MNRPWLDAYPPGVPSEIDPARYESLVDLLESSFERNANHPAFVNLGQQMTFADVDRLSRDFAAWLQTEMTLQHGDRVAVMMPNLLQYPVAAFGILRAGFAVVNVNPLYTSRELEHQLADSGAKVLLVLENFASTAAKIIDKTQIEKVIVTRIGDHFSPLKRVLTNIVVKHVKRMIPSWCIDGTVDYRDVLKKGRTASFEKVAIRSGDTAFLQYTGGTTGVAKGAVLTHRNIVSNVLQAAAWTRPVIQGPGDLIVTPLPLYHIFSLTVNLFNFIEIGASNMLITNPRDVPGFIKQIKNARFSFITGVNTLFVALMQRSEFSDVDFSQLKGAMGGGMAVQRAVSDDWEAITGLPIIQGYGLTETSPVICGNPLTATGFNGSVGVPLPSTDVAIFDDKNNPLPIGEVGEICARGPQVMQGYWQRPEATEEIMFGDGWIRTGDVGRMDEKGYFFIEDRLKDLIIVSGFNVFPSEIEDVVVSHPDVVEAAVIGVPDESRGEAVKLFVVAKDPSLTAEDIDAFCRERLTAYKTPDIIEFRDDLPKSNVGKVLKRELRD
jgi:long-chain acyl-CoA synthetase